MALLPDDTFERCFTVSRSHGLLAFGGAFRQSAGNNTAPSLSLCIFRSAFSISPLARRPAFGGGAGARLMEHNDVSFLGTSRVRGARQVDLKYNSIARDIHT